MDRAESLNQARLLAFLRLCVGIGGAGYLAPPLAAAFRIEQSAAFSAFSFAIGSLCITLAAASLYGARRLRSAWCKPADAAAFAGGGVMLLATSRKTIAQSVLGAIVLIFAAVSVGVAGAQSAGSSFGAADLAFWQSIGLSVIGAPVAMYLLWTRLRRDSKEADATDVLAKLPTEQREAYQAIIEELREARKADREQYRLDREDLLARLARSEGQRQYLKHRIERRDAMIIDLRNRLGELEGKEFSNTDILTDENG